MRAEAEQSPDDKSVFSKINAFSRAPTPDRPNFASNVFSSDDDEYEKKEEQK